MTAETDVAERLFDLDLLECRWTGVDLRGRRLTGFTARDIVFSECDLAGAVFGRGCVLTRVRFEGCRLTGTVFAGADLSDVVIQGGTAGLASFRGATATRLWCVDTALREADFAEARLRDCAFLDSDLAGADFRSVQASGVSLHGSRIDEIRSAAALAHGLGIDAEQVIPLGQALVADLGASITERPDAGK